MKKQEKRLKNEKFIDEDEDDSEEESEDVSEKEEKIAKNVESNDIEAKFFKGMDKIHKNKKNFKFTNEEDDDVDENEVGEFFKDKPLTSTDKFEAKKQIKRLRIKLLKLLEEGIFNIKYF